MKRKPVKDDGQFDKVITLPKGQSIEIAPGVHLKFVEMRSGRAKLGFVAPRGVSILRAELKDKKEK